MLSKDDNVNVEMIEQLVQDVVAYSAVSSDGRVRFNASVSEINDIADKYEIERGTLQRIIMLASQVASDDSERERVSRDAADRSQPSVHQLYNAIVLLIVQYWERLAEEARRMAPHAPLTGKI